MALSLRFGSEPLDTTAPLRFDNSTVMDAANQDIADASQLRRGWVTAGYQNSVGELATASNDAALRGDGLRAAYLKQLAEDEAARAQAWAPTTQAFTDINGVGSALDWAGGALGNMRTSVAPAVGGLIGTGLGAAAGYALKNPALGAKIGGFLGASVPAYQMEKGESVAGAVLDPNNIATPEQIDRAGTVKGLINAGLEAAVPYGLSQNLAGLGKQVAKGEAKKYLAKELAKNAGEEFLTEGTQSLVGQGAENYLQGRDLTDFDYKQAFNEGMAGAVGGAGMGGIGAAGSIAHSQFGRGVDAAKDFAANPTEKIGNAIADLGDKAGEYFGGKKDATEKEVDRLSKLSDEELVAQLLPQRKASVADPLSDEDKALDDKSLLAKHDAMAKSEAEEILKAPSRTYTPEVVQAANDIVMGRGDGMKLASALRTQKDLDESDDMLRAIEGAPKSKKSLMRPTLTDDRGEQEGRDMSQDFVTDNFGRVVRGTGPARGTELVSQKQKGIEGLTTGENIEPHLHGAGTDAVNASKTLSQTPYSGDSFGYGDGNSPSITSKDVSENNFNYDSIQRSAGVKAAQDANKSEMKKWEYRILDSIQRIRAQKSQAKTTEADAVKDRQTVKLADVMVNAGFAFGDKSVINAATSAAQKEEHATRLAGLITWGRYGFQNQAEVIPATLKLYGKGAVDLVRTAYEAGVKEGIIKRDDAAFKKIEQEFVDQEMSEGQAKKAIMANLKETLKPQVTKDNIGGLIKELRGVAERGATSAADRRILETLFGPAEEGRTISMGAAAALEPFGHKPKATQTLGDTGLTDAALEEGEQLDDADPRTVRDAESAYEAAPSKTEDHFNGDKGFFNLQDPEQKAAYAKLKKDREGADQTARIEGRELGIVDHALEQAAAEKGGDLTEKQRFKVLQKLVHEHNPGTVKLAALPKHASQLTRQDHAKRKAEYERLIESKARALNKQHVALRVTTTEAEKSPLEFTQADIDDLKLNRDLRTTTNAQGTLVFQRVSANGRALKEPFITSAPMLLRHMFMGQKREAYVHTLTRGSAYTVHDLLLDGITSLATAEGFSGKFGIVKDGEPVWLSGKQDLPGNLLVLGGNESKKKAPRFYGEVRDSSINDRLIGDIKEYEAQDGNFVEREVNTPQGKVITLSKRAEELMQDTAPQAADDTPGQAANREEAARLKGLNFAFWNLIKQNVAELPAGKSWLKDIGQRFNTLLRSDATAEEKLAISAKIEKLTKSKLIDLPVGKEKLEALINQIDEAFEQHFPEGKTYQEQKDQRWKEEEGQVGDDSIRDSDPKGELGARDNRGLIDSDNTEMVAAGLTGTSKPLTKGAEDKGPLATKGVKSATDFVVPTDDELHAAVADNLKASNSNIEPRKLSVEERRMVRSAWTELARRGMGKVMEGVGHVLAFTASNHNALMMGEGWKGSKSVIGLNATLFTDLKERLFGNLGQQMRYVLAHEVGHNIDIAGDKSNPGYHSSHPGFEMGDDGAVGTLAREMQAAALSGTNPFSALLLHTPFKQAYEGRSLAAQRELFAQAFAMYTERKDEMREHLPLTYAHMEALNGRGYTVQQSTKANTGTGANNKDSASPVQEGNNARAGQSSGVRAGQRAVGAKPALQRIREKLDTIKPANAIHKKAIENLTALLDGEKQGDIAKAMRDMTRWDQTLGDLSERQREQLQNWVEQRGGDNNEQVPIDAYDDELSYDPEQAEFDREMYDGEPVAQPVSQSQQNLVDAAKPPAFAREKEQAKLNGADYVFAPLGVNGSFASRLADAAKAAGRLIDPNGTENIRDKVVYVSVPGASRGFTGIEKLLADVRKLLDRGAIIRTDTKERAGTPHNAEGEGKLRQMLAFGNYVLTEGEQFDSWQKNLPRVKASKQQANSQKAQNTPQADQATQDKVNAFLHKVLGDKIKVEFVGAFIDKSSGEWEASDTGNVIRIALNGDVMGTGFHEAVHELFDMLRKHGGEKIIKQLEQAAMSPLMQKRLERMLDGHPEAIKQLAQPEEAVAFMFQFWMMDPSGFQIGPQTKTFFQKVKDFIAKVAGLFSESVRNDLIKRTAQDKDAVMTDALLSMFAEGALGAADSRQAVIDKLNSHVEKHEAAMRHIGDGVTKLWDVLDSKAGRLVMTAEGVIEATNNPYWKDLSLDFHQKAGTTMRAGWRGGRGGFAEAVRQEENTRMAHLERLFQGADKADLELARKHLSEGTKPDAKEARRLYDGIRAYLDDFQKYISERKVTRLERNEASGEYEWVPVQFRQDYWPQAFDVDALLKNTEQFKADLLQHHRKQLEAIAKEANAAVKAKKADGPASKAVLEAAVTTEITPERIAEEILSRVVNRNQLIDISETDSQLGITPAAAAVNRRTLDWLDMSVFDKYMDKDVVNILSGYTASMVKRAEAQVRFGNGGERIQEAMDQGLLHEMGGDDLVGEAEAALPGAVEAWKQRAAAYYEDHKSDPQRVPYSQVEPLPTLRSVGTKLHSTKVSADQYKADLMAAVKKAEGVEKAVMGMEGTLGRDISPNKRALNSWITTYQNFRTLSLSLFQSFSDVMGVVREGGEFSDAWDAFVMGMREVRNTWKKELSDDPRFLRAEDWGAVDAGASMESYGSMSNSIFMTGKAKQLSDSFFRWNGMEGWNRGTRALAANVAERIITKWAEHGIDSNDKAAVARFERLFGEGAKTSQIKLDTNGRLDINDLDNRAAVNRWVLDAIATPNGAIKALYANDPNYSIFYALKNFSYAMHRVALKGAVAQARLGNYRPAAILATGYIPIIIAANAVKEMLIPGDEPPWMQKGLGGWLGYGWDRAGLLGVPQMYAQNLFDADPAAAFGPTVDQLQNILSIPFPEIKVDLPGFDPMTLHRDHTLLGEGFGSLPFGSVLRRIEKLAA